MKEATPKRKRAKRERVVCRICGWSPEPEVHGGPKGGPARWHLLATHIYAHTTKR